jgi:hypothetical protein
MTLHFKYRLLGGVTLVILALVASVAFLAKEEPIDFSADVKPILNKKCISCHGGVKAQGGFSVLFQEEALAVTESGRPAIIPGDPEGSEMIKRILSDDPEERMPYKHEKLSKEEIAVLKKWIKQGAKWGEHWAYVPVAETPVPTERNSWIKNDIDQFVYQKLLKEKLTPSPEADKATLLRRVSLDLIGIYPEEKIARRFLENTRENAYEELVDSLLASPAFGERWASLWLDLSRYADTKGYESDNGRSVWRYRDWLIKSLNEDKPYDTFVTEQIAGDLLPNATDDQYIATAFSRNAMNNDEGGTDNEEFRVAAVMDRVNTTWESLMSTTFACVQCHSHPYDPFRHEEYYQFMAYFNNTRDEDIPADYPLLREFSSDSIRQEHTEVVKWIKQLGSADDAEKLQFFLRTWSPAINLVFADSLKNAIITNNNGNLAFSNYSSACIKNINLEGTGQMVLRFFSNTPGGVLKLRLGRADGPVFATASIRPEAKWRDQFVEYPVQSGISDVYLTYENPSLSKKAESHPIRFDWVAFVPPFPGKGEKGYEQQRIRFQSLVSTFKGITTTPIMVENPDWLKRKTHVFERGNRMTLGKAVEPAVPQSLRFSMPEEMPANRLGLAQWMTDPNNPLVSRTMVNRLWEQLFGTGIVETLEDMGTQGMPPTHKELLDYLSWKFMNDYRWSTKSLLKSMVMSATYRQDSKLTEEIAAKDLANKWHARGPRVRLSAEQMRDQALSISGLASRKMFGPSVMPWQPKGIWLSPYNRADWKNSTGEDQYRRALYTYWKRTAPYPSMITFDGVARVLCTARRIKTNTPLQALVTLNDSAYLDMARHFALRMDQEGGASLPGKLTKGYALMLYKSLQPQKLAVFEELYGKAYKEFENDPLKARLMMGDSTRATTAEAAALVVVANAMLNLDEVVMKN